MKVCDDLHSVFTSRISVYYVRTKDFNLTSYLLAISDYMEPVQFTVRPMQTVLVYIDPNGYG